MNICTLPHIPERLHTKERLALKEFFIDEELYWRCKPKIELPYSAITLSDVSHNRQGHSENIISESLDVLWNIDASKDFEKYEYDIVVLKIKELLPNHTFSKQFEEDNYKVSMSLIHEPINCNYAHTIFKFIFQLDTEVTFKNYDDTLGSKKAKKIRSLCKIEIQKMIIRKELRLTEMETKSPLNHQNGKGFILFT